MACVRHQRAQQQRNGPSGSDRRKSLAEHENRDSHETTINAHAACVALDVIGRAQRELPAVSVRSVTAVPVLDPGELRGVRSRLASHKVDSEDQAGDRSGKGQAPNCRRFSPRPEEGDHAGNRRDTIEPARRAGAVDQRRSGKHQAEPDGGARSRPACQIEQQPCCQQRKRHAHDGWETSPAGGLLRIPGGPGGEHGRQRRAGARDPQPQQNVARQEEARKRQVFAGKHGAGGIGAAANDHGGERGQPKIHGRKWQVRRERGVADWQTRFLRDEAGSDRVHRPVHAGGNVLDENDAKIGRAADAEDQVCPPEPRDRRAERLPSVGLQQNRHRQQTRDRRSNGEAACERKAVQRRRPVGNTEQRAARKPDADIKQPRQRQSRSPGARPGEQQRRQMTGKHVEREHHAPPCPVAARRHCIGAAPIQSRRTVQRRGKNGWHGHFDQVRPRAESP